MARIARVIAPGLPHHVTQRGNRRQQTFFRDDDYREYLLTKVTKGDSAQRYVAKWRLTKLLYERNWEKQQIIDLFSVIDWMIRLPTDLEKQLWQELTNLERSKTMPYVTSVERIGIEKGIQQGLQLGLEQGLQQGMQQGESLLLRRILIRRFGTLPGWAETRLADATLAELESWGEAVLEAKSLEEIFRPSRDLQ